MKVFTISAALAELWPESVASIHRFQKNDIAGSLNLLQSSGVLEFWGFRVLGFLGF